MDASNEPAKKLYRSRTERIVAGVCGGAAKYFNLDPILVRGLFILLTLINGSGILLYLILLVIVPLEPGAESTPNLAGEMKDAVQNVASGLKDGSVLRTSRRDTLALIIIAIGLLLLVNQIFPFRWFRWDLFWPVVIILIGVWILVREKK